MKRLNIAIICDAIDDFIGGSFVSALRFCELLSKKGHKVIIISSKYPATPEIDHYKNIKMYRMPAFPVPLTNKELYFSYPCSKKIKNILEKEKC